MSTNDMGVLRQDNNCHWYFIPMKEAKRFDRLRDKGDDDALEAFWRYHIEDPSNHVWIMVEDA